MWLDPSCCDIHAIYVLFRDDGVVKLPYYIALSGFVCALFSFGVPYLSALRIWLGFSTLFSLIYIVIAFVLSLRDGIATPANDYTIPGSHSARIFTTIGAVANLVFAYNTGMLPEIRATIRPPVVKNMEKDLWFQFTVGSLPLYAVTFMGYWAYGSSTSSYLLYSVKGPVWIKTLANLSAFLQTVVALHIFASPMYEFLDTKYGKWTRWPFCNPQRNVQSECERRLPERQHHGGCDAPVPWRLHEPDRSSQHLPPGIRSCKSHVPDGEAPQAALPPEMLALAECCWLQPLVRGSCSCCAEANHARLHYLPLVC